MGTIGQNIKRFREMNGLSMNQLAKLIGKSRSAISQYELGQAVPRMGTIEDLARVFGVSKMEILNEGEDGNVALTLDERELVDLYRTLSQKGRHAVLAGLRDFAGRRS